MSIVHDTAVYFDPYDVDINADPYPAYARLRDEAPIYYNERYDFWALSRHDDVQKALVNWQTFSNTRSDILDIIKAGVELPPGVILFEDPPIHTMHRGLMSRVFTPRAHGRARGPGARVLRRLPRPAGRLRRVRHRRRARVDDAHARDRHAPRHPRAGPGRRPQQDRRQPAHRARQADGRQAGRVANGDMFADYIDWRAEAPVRRPDDAAAQRRVRGRARRDAHAHPPGGAHVHRGDRRRRQRDDGAAHRVAGQGARRAPRPAARRGRGPLAAPERDRRDAAVRAHRARHRPGTSRRTSSTTAPPCPAGSADPAAHGVGQPRPAPIRAPRRVRRPPRRRCSTSPSATGCTTASAPTSPGSKGASRSTSC